MYKRQSLLYLTLGFFNILFAWLGLLCFLIPLIISVSSGTKGYCNRYCGRGQLFALLGGRLGLSRKRDIPKWMKSSVFRYGFLAFFFTMFFLMLWNTHLVFAGAQDLKQVEMCIRDRSRTVWPSRRQSAPIVPGTPTPETMMSLPRQSSQRSGAEGEHSVTVASFLSSSMDRGLPM